MKLHHVKKLSKIKELIDLAKVDGGLLSSDELQIEKERRERKTKMDEDLAREKALKAIE
jgi:hypothetical protein